MAHHIRRASSAASVDRRDTIARVSVPVRRFVVWAALALSLSPGADFQGDRVAAFIYANADMLVTAHGERAYDLK